MKIKSPAILSCKPSMVIAVATCLLPCFSAIAADRIWTPAGSNTFWSTAANWGVNGPPNPSITDDILRFDGNTYGTTSNNNIGQLRFESLSVFGTFSVSPRKSLTGSRLLLDGMAVNLAPNSRFHFDNPIEVSGSSLSITYDLGGNTNNFTNKPTVFFNEGLDIKGQKLRMTGFADVEITNLTANNRSLTSTFLDLSRTRGGSVEIMGSPSITGTLELNGGILILKNGLPATRITMTDTTFGSVETILRASGTVQELSCNSSIIEPGTLNPLTINGPLFVNTFSKVRMELGPLGRSMIEAKNTVSISATDLEIIVTGNRPTRGSEIRLIDKTSSGNISGTFREVPQNGLIAAMDGRSVYRINYRGGTGNDLVATRVNAPAPTIATTTLAPNPNDPENTRLLTITGQGVPHQLLTVRTSTNLDNFSHHSTFQLGRTGFVTRTITVPITEERFFVKLAVVDAD